MGLLGVEHCVFRRTKDTVVFSKDDIKIDPSLITIKGTCDISPSRTAECHAWPGICKKSNKQDFCDVVEEWEQKPFSIHTDV